MAAPIRFIAAILAGLFLWGLYDFAYKLEPNGCDMTYMYERIDYVHVKMAENVANRFPKYNLHLYGEGSYIQKMKRQLKPKGVPVLFIPGNAGSYKQVRSLASVAHRKGNDMGHKWKFNYFTVDFNEELSGLYGGVLKDQTKFVQQCIKHILALYAWKSAPPTSVILVGHSMGGLIPRALFTLPSFNPQHVDVIITIATPHQEPVILLDRFMQKMYQQVNDYWRTNGNSTLSHVAVVSVAGGYRDIMIPDGITTLTGLAADGMAISTVSSAVPKVWVSTDHQCIVWCHQLVMATKRAMFDLIKGPAASKQVTKDSAEKMSILRHHFVSNYGPKHYGGVSEIVDIDQSATLHEENSSAWTFTRSKVGEPRYIEVPLTTMLDTFLVITNQNEDDWIFACMKPKEVNSEEAEHAADKASSKQRCNDATNLSHKTLLLPTREGMWKTIAINTTNLAGYYDTIMIRVGKSDKKVEVWAEQFGHRERRADMEVPSFWTFHKATDVLALSQGQLYYELSLGSLASITQAITVSVQAHDCKDERGKNVTKGEVGVMRFLVPWSAQNEYKHISLDSHKHGQITLKLQAAPPEGDTRHAQLQMWLHPRCRYSIAMQPEPQQLFGQIVRHYGHLIPVNWMMNLMLILVWQLLTVASDGMCATFEVSHLAFASPHRVLIVGNLISYVLWSIGCDNLNRLGIPMPDKYLEPTRQPGSQLFAIFLYLVAYFLTMVVAMVLSLIIRILAFLMSFIVRRNIPFLGYAAVPLLLAVAFRMCGSLALIVGLVLYAIKVVSARVRMDDTPATRGRFNRRFTILQLWICVTLFNLPSAVVWFKNLSFIQNLESDPAVFHALVLALVFPIEEVIESPTGIKLAGYSSYALAIMVGIYSTQNMYRAPYLASIAMVIASVCSVSMPGDNAQMEKKTN
ncbi:PREDICTED: GPI inositol-deacylase-like isoform X2 [Priapulus caudatus]|uniref:GPI inositol-deacylase n=1 Tax=Priapulus caudatus TaxID=37621 RepID=A0ABM1F1C5_PRICU|nr:PREDICTED: GPI inositol-deacylase-like isoform X2 [Priapulus caudatus]